MRVSIVRRFTHARFAKATVLQAITLCTLGAAVAGCASTSSGTERKSMTVDEDRKVFRAVDQGIKMSFKAPRDSVWRAVVGAYTDLGLLPELADTSTWVVARMKIPMRRVYDGMRTSALFSCGETMTGGSNADNGQIVASARSQIIGSDATTTRIATLVDAYVIPDGGTSSNALHCGSTGAMESRLHKAIAARLGLIDFGS
jgi:hypothetical protein